MKPTGVLQQKEQELADLAVREGLQGALQFCAFQDGECIVDVWAGAMAEDAGAAMRTFSNSSSRGKHTVRR